MKSTRRCLFHWILINLIFFPTICPSRIFIRPSFEEKSSEILINLKSSPHEYFHWFLFPRYFTNAGDLSRIFIYSAFEKMLSRNGHLKILNISASWALALVSMWTTVVHDGPWFVHICPPTISVCPPFKKNVTIKWQFFKI